MTIVLHWWAFPTAVTVAFLIWCLWPKYTSAMRCYVASKLGEVVEVPEELK